MSALTPFLAPSDQAQPLARSRFRLLASRLSSSDLSSFANDAQNSFAKSWLSSIEDSSSVRHLPETWRSTLDQHHKSGAATEFPLTSFVSNLLGKLESDLPDADYASIWMQLENSMAYLRRRKRFELLTKECNEIAKRVISRVEAVYGQGDRMEADLDFKSLENALVAFFQDWGQPTFEGSAHAAVVAVHSFHRRIIAKHEASTDAWQLLLQSLNSDAGLQDIGTADLVEVLTEALPRFTTLKVFSIKSQRAETPLPEDLRTLAGLHMILTAAPQSHLAKEAMSILQFDRISTSVGKGTKALEATLKGLREDMRKSLEQYQIDWWDEAHAWMQRIHEGEKTLRGQSVELGNQAKRVFANCEDPRRLSALALELIHVVVRLGNGSIDSGLTAPILRHILVGDYGCDPKSAPWTQVNELTAGLVEILKQIGTNKYFLPARAQLRKLSEICAEVGNYGLTDARTAAGDAWSPIRPLMPDPELNTRCKRDLGFMLQRVALEHRLARPLTAQHAVLRWYADEVAIYLNHLPDQGFIDQWLDLITNSSAPLQGALLEAARNTHQNLPRLTTALKLIHHHEELGLDAAKHVMNRLPDYHKTVGENGTKLCARDNALTLLQAGRILLSGVENPAEHLAAWWNSVVAAYIVNRPTQLFEANLQGIHATMLENLAPAEVDSVFPILHQVYKESLGIQDLPLLFFREARDFDLIPAHAKNSEAAKALPASANRSRWVKRVSSMVNRSDKALNTQLNQFLQRIEAAFGSPATNEQAWLQMRPHLRKWGETSDSTTLIRCLASLASEGASDNSSSGRDLSELALQGVRFVAQDLLAAQLESSWATAAGPRIAATATSGGGDDVAQSKCSRDLQLMTDFLIRQLRSQSFETAALNTLRFLIECVVPYVGYPAETWQDIFNDWKRSHASKMDDNSRPLFDALVDLFSESSSKFLELRKICAHSFSAGSTVFSTEVSTEKMLRKVFSIALIHNIAPERGLLNRDTLRGVGFSRGTSSSSETEDIFKELVLHLDRLFDQLEGDIYYQMQEVIPKCREAYLGMIAENTSPEPPSSLHASLAETKLNLNVFKKISQALSGPKDEEMASDIWRAIMAVGLSTNSQQFNSTQSTLLANWLIQTAPENAGESYTKLSGIFASKGDSANLPEHVRSLLSQLNAA